MINPQAFDGCDERVTELHFPTGRDRTPRQLESGWRASAYWLLASLFFVLGMLGIILPVLPTTPFLLAMCYFLLRVSPSLHARVLKWPLVGKTLRVWHEQSGVTHRVKFTAITTVTLVVGCSTSVIAAAAMKILLLLLALGGIVLILRLPVAKC